jgi:hypothetical protein
MSTAAASWCLRVRPSGRCVEGIWFLLTKSITHGRRVPLNFAMVEVFSATSTIDILYFYSIDRTAGGQQSAAYTHGNAVPSSSCTTLALSRRVSATAGGLPPRVGRVTCSFEDTLPDGRPRDDDDGGAGAVRVRRRVCVMAAEVVRVQKRVCDGDDDDTSRGRVVRVRRGVEAGGASTPHQDGGGGILSGSGAV